MKWHETKFCENQKFITKKNFIESRELLLKFRMKFAQLSSIFTFFMALMKVNKFQPIGITYRNIVAFHSKQYSFRPTDVVN